MGNQLGKIDHIVQLMLENRSFDHMLGYLYADSGNRSPAGQDFDGLTGEEWNPDDLGRQVRVFRIKATDPHPYLMPGADPGEGFFNINFQLFSSDHPWVDPGESSGSFRLFYPNRPGGQSIRRRHDRGFEVSGIDF